MLVRTDDNDKGFIMNPYNDEVFRVEISRRRRYYFKQGILKVKRHPIARSLFILRYKDRYVASWSACDSGAVAHDLIDAVCRTLDIVEGR